jgi:uncharacterized protein (DUF2267 family)
MSPAERFKPIVAEADKTKTYLQRPASGPVSYVSLDDFFQRVSRREGVSIETAIEHARAVASVLRDALSEGEFEDILAELPPEIYNELFAS